MLHGIWSMSHGGKDSFYLFWPLGVYLLSCGVCHSSVSADPWCILSFKVGPPWIPIFRDVPWTFNQIGRNFVTMSTLYARCHILLAVPGQFLWRWSLHWPIGGMQVPLKVCLVLRKVWGRWFVWGCIYLNVFQAGWLQQPTLKAVQYLHWLISVCSNTVNKTLSLSFSSFQVVSGFPGSAGSCTVDLKCWAHGLKSLYF